MFPPSFPLLNGERRGEGDKKEIIK